MHADEIKNRLKTAFPDATIELKDLAGDNDHFAVTITSPQFRGLNRVAQHKLVFQALQGAMGGELHALQVTTRASE